MTQSAIDLDSGRHWKGAVWLADQLIATGFEVPRVATVAFVAEALANGFLTSSEDHDRFWAEWANELVRNGFQADGRIAGYRSQYIERLLAGRDLRTFVEENSGLFGWTHGAVPIEIRQAFHARVLEVVEMRKTIERKRPDVTELADRLARGPAETMKALAADLPLEVCKGRDIGLPIDGPCLLGQVAGQVRPFLFWESGRHWRQLGDLSVQCGVQIGGEIRFSNPSDLCRGLHWYKRVGSPEDAALGLTAYAHFVVGLSGALIEQDTAKEADT